MIKKIALFHPWIKSKGGAEKTVLEILKNIKNVELYTWVYEKENTFEEFQRFKINIIGKKFFRRFSHSNILRGAFLINSLFSKIPLEKYDVFLISTSGVGEFITFRNKKPGNTYAYIHTPLRDADEEIINWNLKNRHKGFLYRIIYRTAINLYKFIEKIAWKKIDFVIFNSELSLERARKRNLIDGKKVKIIYPPADIEEIDNIKTKYKDYFLYPSRINNPKRQDLLIKSWKIFSQRHPDEKLIITGNIENKKYYEGLRKLSKNIKNVYIKTNLANREFMKLYKECKAVIFIPFMEDFGIIPFEALALGKPLIAVDSGGYVKLIEKIPQYYKIRELSSEKMMVNEINSVLEKFLDSKIKPKKIKNLIPTTHNFIEYMKNTLKL